jgi:GNAT superfamily N-acetyltransferase
MDDAARTTTAVRLDPDTASAAGIGEIARVLARAFLGDPFYVYMMPGESPRSVGLAWWMSCMCRYGLAYGRVYVTSAPIVGAAIWLRPESATLELAGMVRVGVLAAPFRLGIRGCLRGLAVAAEWERLRRRERASHWHLIILGVEPEQQRRGTGRALIRPVVQEADRDGVHCYLETVTSANVRFYESQGFEVVAEGGFGTDYPYWTMRRRPGGAGE